MARNEGAADRVRAVYEADHARLWRSLYAFSGSSEVADEAAAEAFAQALRRGDEIRDVAAWVWRSAYAIARGELQRRRRTGAGVPPERPAPEPDELTGLLATLAELPEADRELIVLCHVAGWRPGELAAVLDANPGAIRVRLHRATTRARELLEGSER
ncbi:MAG TPA: sigma-70 family RNA polymerase sigma factor [Ilumatobacter sp.]|nr:sigma-70 family RNA polymerase sigma factor [Ilumatobacter sp.]